MKLPADNANGHESEQREMSPDQTVNRILTSIGLISLLKFAAISVIRGRPSAETLAAYRYSLSLFSVRS
jgi:hypothetical protein